MIALLFPVLVSLKFSFFYVKSPMLQGEVLRNHIQPNKNWLPLTPLLLFPVLVRLTLEFVCETEPASFLLCGSVPILTMINHLPPATSSSSDSVSSTGSRSISSIMHLHSGNC